MERAAAAPERLGVYVHVPFCATRCDYCDFATWTDRDHLIEEYVDACVVDARRQVRVAGGAPAVTSVFFGGGTPSLLSPRAIGRILDAIPLAPGAEVTLECNPDSVDRAKLAGYRRAGVGRLSFGVQSLRPHVLLALGRTHDPAAVSRALDAARDAGFARLNVDLIYGAQGESLDDWRATLEGTIALGPPHVSAYALTVEPATALGRRVASGSSVPPDDDDQATKYEMADDVLGAAGLRSYEISNWARPGDECRHNLLYWEQGDYLAIGCAAHGHRAGERWWNWRAPERYLAAVAAGRTPRAGSERLDDETRREEALVLAIRTRGGAVVGDAASREVARLVEAGVVRRAGPRVVLTRAGRLIANDVTARLLAAGAATPDGEGPPGGSPRPPPRVRAPLALGRLEC